MIGKFLGRRTASRCGRLMRKARRRALTYLVFFHYGPDEGSGKKRIPILTIVAITPHP